MREHTDAACWCRPRVVQRCPLCRLHGDRAGCPGCGGSGTVAPFGCGVVYVVHRDREGRP